MEPKKNVFLSKTFWFGLLTAIVPALSTSAQAFVVDNTVMITSIWGLAAIILRMVTKDKVILLD
jgi:uncharacterized membrane protein